MKRAYCWAILLLLAVLCPATMQGAVAFSLSLDAPTNGATFGNADKWVVKVTALGDALTNVSVFTNGVLLYQRTNAPFNKTNETLAQGTYTIYASAADSTGATTNTPTNTFTIYGGSIEFPVYNKLPPNTVSAITNAMPFLIGTVGAVSTTNLANSGRSRMVALQPGHGFGFMATLGATNTTTANVTFIFELTQDRTNYTTTTNMQFVMPLNGTNRVCMFTNFPATLYDNIAGVRLRQIDNGNTNKTWVTNAWFTIK